MAVRRHRLRCVRDQVIDRRAHGRSPRPGGMRLAALRRPPDDRSDWRRVVQLFVGPGLPMAVSLSSDAGRRSGGFRRRERMRWIRYAANGHPVYGIVEGDMVTEVRGDPFAGHEKTTTRRPLS